MNEKLVYKGYWWLPSNPKESVTGVLTYTSNEKIALKLIGSFGAENSTIEGFLNENIIHGLTSESKKITLINCHEGGESFNLSCTFPLIRYNCQFIFIGKYLGGIKQNSFYKTIITIAQLSK